MIQHVRSDSPRSARRTRSGIRSIVKPGDWVLDEAARPCISRKPIATFDCRPGRCPGARVWTLVRRRRRGVRLHVAGHSLSRFICRWFRNVGASGGIRLRLPSWRFWNVGASGGIRLRLPSWRFWNVGASSAGDSEDSQPKAALTLRNVGASSAGDSSSVAIGSTRQTQPQAAPTFRLCAAHSDLFVSSRLRGLFSFHQVKNQL